MTALTYLTFSSFSGFYLSVDLADNNITTLPVGTIGLCQSQNFDLDLSRNRLGALPAGTFADFRGQDIRLDVTGNEITTLGPIFESYTGEGFCNVDMSSNRVTAPQLVRALNSYTSTLAELVLNVSHNLVTEVPANLFSGVGSRAVAATTVSVDLSANPLVHVHPFAHASGEPRATLSGILLNLSNPTRRPLVLPHAMSFEGITWLGSTQAVYFDFSNTGVNLSVVNLISASANPPGVLSVALRSNNYTDVLDGAFVRSRASSIDLRDNFISYVSPRAFNYTLELVTLDLSNNRLSVLSVGLMSNTPALTSLVLENNEIAAVPQTSNHIATAAAVVNNILRCDRYGPETSGCACRAGFALSTFCGYTRCTPSGRVDGCGNDTIFNSSDCSSAPWSSCVTGAVENQFYSPIVQAFLPITQCSTAFPENNVFLQAYEVQAPHSNAKGTATSDRLCSVCSSCPTGFDTTPCTPTSNTKCTKSTRLSVGDVAAIALACILLFVAATLGAMYGRRQAHRRAVTQSELELTEKLLDDVHDENVLMEQAWSIVEDDLTFGTVLGEGAFGRVHCGIWGYVWFFLHTVCLDFKRTLVTGIFRLLSKSCDIHLTILIRKWWRILTERYAHRVHVPNTGDLTLAPVSGVRSR